MRCSSRHSSCSHMDVEMMCCTEEDLDIIWLRSSPIASTIVFLKLYSLSQADRADGNSDNDW